MNNNMNINEEFGPETMTIEKDISNLEESVKIDIQDEHIGEKTCLVLETPGGESEIVLNGDYETNILITDLLVEIVNLKYGRGNSPVSLYSKTPNLTEEMIAGVETKFEANSVGAMIGLLQKTGQMTDKLTLTDISNGEQMMPVSIEKKQDGTLMLGIAKGTPAQDPAIPAEQSIIA